VSSRSLQYALATTSGILLALSFPRYGHPALSWIALAPLLVALASAPSIRALALGLTTGAVYFTGTLYWITRVMVRYGDLPTWVAVLVNAALVATLSLYTAAFAYVVRRLTRAYGPRAMAAAPIVWVATELARNYPFGGFPWVLLGYSQATVLPIAQLASLFGVYGVSMLVASVSTALAMSVPSNAKHAETAKSQTSLRVLRPFRSWWAAQFLNPPPYVWVGVMVLVVAIWGARRAASADLTRAGEPIRIGLIQGNVTLEERMDRTRLLSIFQNYLSMTRQAIAEGATFVIWPEAATPFRFEEDVFSAARIRALAMQARVAILLGSDQVERNSAGLPAKYYNSAFLVRPDGTTGGAYRKMHLVPFGEYVPAKRLFFFAAPLVENVSDFSAGDTATILPVGSHNVSTAICYEVVYPDLVRRFVVAGSEMLTTITNDAWFGDTSAPYQHFEQASMRAIEEGRYLVRSANTGISGAVDPYGRVLAQTPIFQRAVLVVEARFLTGSTFYARHGDVLAYASAVLTIAFLAIARTPASARSARRRGSSSRDGRIASEGGRVQ
jgi:apolipoprotein N-acyltransferase